MEHRFYPKRCTSSLAETVGNIDELLTEILVRVPARPLVRFKCVSQHWLSLISDPKFCHRHTLRNPNTPISAVFPYRSTKCGFIPIPLDDHLEFGSPFNPLNIFEHEYDEHIKVIQSCSGLLLCNLLDAKKLNPPYIILNPTTNQFSELIPPLAELIPPLTTAVTNDAGQQMEAPYIVSIALAFDPSKSPHYKVVCVRTIDGTMVCQHFHILIYSSETQSWRLLDSSFSIHDRICLNDAVFLNGAIHWVGLTCELSYFQVDEERIGHVPPHPRYMSREKCWGRRIYRYFRESVDKRHLQLIDIYNPCISQFEVLEMGNDYSGWFVKYLVDLDPISTVYPSFQRKMVQILFLAQEENEGEECLSLLMHMPGKAFSYNLKSKTTKSFDLAPMPGLDDSLLRVGSNNYWIKWYPIAACIQFGLWINDEFDLPFTLHNDVPSYHSVHLLKINSPPSVFRSLFDIYNPRFRSVLIKGSSGTSI
ncbi:hypothetical protein ACLB2K_057777 [Fragaria x ananassa]